MVSEPQLSIQLPVLDILKPLEPSSLSSLAEACKEWGFFHIINHGISKEHYSRLRLLSELIFGLPSDSKIKLGPFSPEKTYTPHHIASPFFESLKVSGPDFAGSAHISADVLLPNNNSEFSELLEAYGSKMVDLSEKIVRIVLMCLGDGFEKKYYDSEFKNCHGYLRINNYSSPETLSDDMEVEGLGMHTDMSCVTIVYQDHEVGGLQMRSKQGNWIDISPCEGTLVVNIGDMLQAWSNDKLRSSEHRVVLRKMVNRFSLAFFWCFEDGKMILAPDQVVGEENKRFYKPFVCSDYLRFRESNEKGRFEKVGFTVKDLAGTGNLQM
ncbi:gibberellin 20-oxidase-like protein [Impatiens glandulifera]|uniref:gibberellin 20-oxidase-like protein n=1 Tax=Impatiens glandulifera TaxID=253017 RepID=UPI001FB0ABA9|nr:gibberellin 20-oxidase-like protein [Impatiens glandulifera]